jgi:hypothetical protein
VSWFRGAVSCGEGIERAMCKLTEPPPFVGEAVHTRGPGRKTDAPAGRRLSCDAICARGWDHSRQIIETV